MKNHRQKRFFVTAIFLLVPLVLFFAIREQLSWRPRITGQHKGSISELVWSPDGTKLVSCDFLSDKRPSGQLFLWSIKDKKYQILPSDGNYWIRFCANNKITSTTSSFHLRIYDANKPTTPFKITPVKSNWIISPDGQLLGGETKQPDDLAKWIPNNLVLVRLSNAKQSVLKTPDMRSTALNRTAFSSDSQKFAVVIANAPEHPKPTIWIWDVNHPNNPQIIKINPHGGGEDIFFWPDNSSIAAINGSNLEIYDLISGKQKFNHLFIQNIALSPTGDILAHGGNGYIEVLQFPSLQLVRKLPSADIASNSHPMAFSPDGKTLAIGELNGKITLWRVK